MARIVRTVSTKVVSKNVCVKVPTPYGYRKKCIPIRAQVKVTKVRVVR